MGHHSDGLLLQRDDRQAYSTFMNFYDVLTVPFSRSFILVFHQYIVLDTGLALYRFGGGAWPRSLRCGFRYCPPSHLIV